MIFPNCCPWACNWVGKRREKIRTEKRNRRAPKPIASPRAIIAPREEKGLLSNMREQALEKTIAYV
jgi:hypothetical protein